MQNNTLSFLLIYMTILLLSLNINSWWWMWLMFELLNWFLIVLMKSNYTLPFLIWQSFSSIMIMISTFFMKKVLIMIMMLKMGLPPFHYWVTNLNYSWHFNSFLIFVTIHKYLPCLILMNFVLMNWLSLMFILLGILLFWYSFHIKSLIFGMSIVDMFWMISSWFSSFKVFMLYLILNFMIFLMWLKVWKKLNINFNLLNMQIMLVFLMNLPPFSTFVMKWLILSLLPMVLGFFSLMGSWLLINMIWFWLSLQLVEMSMMSKSKNFVIMILVTNMIWII